MPLYRDMEFTDWLDYLICLRASIADATITVAILIVGRYCFGRWRWYLPISLLPAVYIVLAGTLVAIGIEAHALRNGKWAYSPYMPLVPLLGVGVIPVVQLVLLPYVSFFISAAEQNSNRRQHS